MTEEENKRFEKLENDFAQLTKMMDTMINNQEQFANSLNNILDYMETHKMKFEKYRPNRLDS